MQMSFIDVNTKNDCDKLLYHGFNINYEVDGYTPLMFSIKEQNYHRCRLLINSGANVNYVSSYHLTPLMIVVNIQNILLYKLLVDNGANINYVDDYEQNILFYCIGRKRYTLFDYIINKEYSNQTINLYQQDIYGNTPLLYLLEDIENPDNCKIEIEMAKKLILLDADVNIRNKNNTNALTLCIQYKLDDLFEYIACNTQFNYLETMKECIENNYFYGFEIMIEYYRNNNLSIDQHNEHIESLIFIAIRNNNIYFLQKILNCGANIYQRNFDNKTPFEVAALHNYIEICSLLSTYESLDGDVLEVENRIKYIQENYNDEYMKLIFNFSKMCD